MKRIIFLILLVLAFAGVILIYTIPNFIDWNQYKDYIIKQISQSHDIEITQADSVEVTFIPANIAIKKAKIKYNQHYNIFAEELYISPKLSDLILGNIVIKAIKIVRANIPIDTISNLVSARNYKITLLNSSLNLHNGQTLQNVDFMVDDSVISGGFYILDQHTNFNITLGNATADKTSFEGKLYHDDISTNVTGNIYFADKAINKIEGDLSGTLESQNISTQFTSSATLENGNISFANTKFKSPMIDADMDIAYNINSNNLTGKITIDNVDLNPIITYEIDQIMKIKSQSTQYYGSYVYNIISKILNFDLDLMIKQAKIYDDIIYNQAFKLDSNSKSAVKIAVQDLKLPNNAKLSFSANIKKVGPKNIIDSTIKLEGQKSSEFLKWLLKDQYDRLFSDLNLEYPFVLSANLYLYDKGISLNNIECMLDNTYIDGYSLLRYNNDSNKDLYSINLRIRNFNADKWKISQKIWPFINYIMPPSNNNDFISDLLNMTGRYNVALIFDHAIINEQYIDDITTAFNIADGVVDLKQFAFNTKKQQWNVVSQLNANQLSPSLSAKLNGSSLNIHELEDIIFVKDLQSNLMDSFLSSPLNWLSRYQYDVSATIDNVTINKDITLNKFETSFKTIDKLYLLLDKLNFMLTGGSFNSSGNLYFTPSSLNIVFAHNNSLLNPILQFFIPNTKFSGYYSISGSAASSNFTNFQEATNNLLANASFAIRDGKVIMYDVDEVANKLANKKYDSNFVKDLNNIMNNAGQHTINYASIDGNIALDKNIVTLSNVSAYSQYTKSNMAGSIDLLNNQINMASKYAFSFANSKSPGEFSINFNGTLDNIKESVENNSLIHTISKLVTQPTQMIKQ